MHEMTFGICSFLNFATQTLWFIWLFVSADGLTVLKVHNENSGGGTCTSDLDCQLNGRCTFGVCICSPAWTGTDCSALNLLPAAIKNGYQNAGSDVSSWGGGVHYDNVTNLFYMFVDEMDKHCGLSVWHQNSRCVVGVSDSPHGPFERVKVVMDSWCHGSSVGHDPVTGSWLFNHMGDASASSTCVSCSNGTTPSPQTRGSCSADGDALYSSMALISTSPLGPYSAAPNIPNDANCEPFFASDGALYMTCPWSKKFIFQPGCDNHNNFLKVKRAASLNDAIAGKWETFPLSYSPAGSNNTLPFMCFNWEDQNMWIDSRGYFHSLMHAFRGEPTDYPQPGCHYNAITGDWAPNGCTSLGGHAFSLNGKHWYISRTPSYTGDVEYEDGSRVTYRARERPHLILSPEGEPTHFISAVGDPGAGGNVGMPFADHTFTLIQPLNKVTVPPLQKVSLSIWNLRKIDGFHL